jgi:hypothetical protein
MTGGQIKAFIAWGKADEANLAQIEALYAECLAAVMESGGTINTTLSGTINGKSFQFRPDATPLEMIEPLKAIIDGIASEAVNAGGRVTYPNFASIER